MSSGNETVVRESARGQITTHRVEGGIWFFLGAIFFVLSLFVAGKADEQAARVGAGIGGAVLMATAVAYVRFKTERVTRLVELLLSHREELREPGIVATRSRGIIIAHAITVRDTKNRRYRMRVPSEAIARQLLAGIPS